MNERRRGLGRGLGALIPSGEAGTAAPTRPVDLFFAPGPTSATDQRSTTARRDDQRSAPAHPAADVAADRGPAPVFGSVVAGRLADEAGVVEPPVDETGDLEARLMAVPGASFREIPVDSIRPNPRQPRQVFDADELAELVTSVREIGVLQPVVVREVADGYELVMGERRWRACREAGLATVPAIVRDTPDDALLRDALLENLHRSQLNPLEEAAAYDQLLRDFGCSHDELATRLGRSRPQISNTIRLLKLPPMVARRVAAGVLSAGHARALLGLNDGAAIERLAQRIVAEGLSVRATEELVALGAAEAKPARRSRTPRPGDDRLDRLADRLSERLDTRVTIAVGARRGRMTVDFGGVDDLERILQLLALDDVGGAG